MGFERNDQQDWTEENGGQWTKEPAKRDPRFDFAAFLGPENLEDRITDVLDGKDLMDKEAYGEFSPDYVPRRGVPGEHGRHEAPGSDPEEDGDGEEDDSREPDGQEPEFEQDPQPRTAFVDEPPPRPKVIVAEPAPRVYVDPRAEYGDVQEPPSDERGGGGKGLKWLIALLISAAVILAAVVLVTTFLPDIGGLFGHPAQPSPTPSGVVGGIPDVRPTDVPAPAATDVPEPTPPELKVYGITASASSGGSVSPSGRVDVQEGGSASFTFTADEGYEISQLVVDGAGGFVQTSYTFSDVRQDHTIYAEFRQVELPPPVAEIPEQPTEEPGQEPTDEPAQEPDGGADQGAPPQAGGEGQPAPPVIEE